LNVLLLLLLLFIFELLLLFIKLLSKCERGLDLFGGGFSLAIKCGGNTPPGIPASRPPGPKPGIPGGPDMANKPAAFGGDDMLRPG
jgi:hypothetical protein